MYGDKVDKMDEDWSALIKRLAESPRSDWGDWSDAAEKAGPYDEDHGGSREVGQILITLSQSDVATIQTAIKQRMDKSGILQHILDELGNTSR